MGEPLASYRRVVAAVRRITDPTPVGLGISQRAVTVLTVGLAPAIRKLADEGLLVRLAVSLHTPDDELRDTLVPVNNRWPVEEVLSAACGAGVRAAGERRGSGLHRARHPRPGDRRCLRATRRRRPALTAREHALRTVFMGIRSKVRICRCADS